MIAPEIRKKILILGLTGTAIIAAFFALWAMVLNRATIQITAQAPYQLTIQNLKTIPCLSNTCSVVVAPGKYGLSITKNGYQEEIRDIAVSLNGKYEETVNLRFMPVLEEVQKPDLFGKKNVDTSLLNQFGLTNQDQIFSEDDGRFLLYLKRQKENFR